MLSFLEGQVVSTSDFLVLECLGIGFEISMPEALTDRKATDERKIELKEKKQKEYFDALYKNWLRSIDDGYDYDVSVNKKLFDDIKF